MVIPDLEKEQFLDDSGLYDEAIAYYDKAIEIEPNETDLWCRKARCYALMGKTDMVIENLNLAISLNYAD